MAKLPYNYTKLSGLMLNTNWFSFTTLIYCVGKYIDVTDKSALSRVALSLDMDYVNIFLPRNDTRHFTMFYYCPHSPHIPSKILFYESSTRHSIYTVTGSGMRRMLGGGATFPKSQFPRIPMPPGLPFAHTSGDWTVMV